MKRIGVYTGDNSLYRKIELLLRKECEVIRARTADSPLGYDRIIFDLDTEGEFYPNDAILLSREPRGEGVIAIPFSLEEMKMLVLNGKHERTIKIDTERRLVRVHDEWVKLTDSELRLFMALFDAEGFVSREELLYTVWGEGQDIGIVNVYIHYLRSKLESGGEKIIISSRQHGYRLRKIEEG